MQDLEEEQKEDFSDSESEELNCDETPHNCTFAYRFDQMGKRIESDKQ